MSISAPRDNNRVPTMLVTSKNDGTTPLSLYVNPTTHGLVISDGTTGSNLTYVNAKRDDNRVPALWGTSTDGVTPIPIYGDPSNHSLLVKST